MAKNNTEATEVPAETETAPAAAETADSRFIMINVPEGDAVTTLSDGALAAGPQKRTDYIRALAATGEYTRGDIAKMVSELQGKKVPYQIVFQATKTIPNVKKVERAAAEAAPAGEAAPAETAPAE